MLITREGGTVGYPIKVFGVWIPSLFLLRHKREVTTRRWIAAWRLATGQLSFADSHGICQSIDNACAAKKRKAK